MESAWVRYPVAATACGVAIVLGFSLDALGRASAGTFLPAIVAIVGSAAWAGAGPGVVTTFLLFIWAVFDLSNHGSPLRQTLLRAVLFLAEGLLLSIGSARLWRSLRDASHRESWHRQLLETAAEGIWVHDENGLITYANARIAEILGTPVAGLIGRNADEFFLPEDLSMERVRAANLRNGQKEQFDRRLRHSDGHEIWVLACANRIDGHAPGVLAMMTDITERKRAEYALRRSEERFRNLFEGVLEGVYQSTPDGRIIAANPMLLRMLGVASEARLNEVDIAHDLYVDPHIRQRLLEQLEREGGFQNVEYELRRRDGELITVLENARVVRDETGAVLYYEGTLSDITPRKRIEEQLRQAQKVEALGRLAGGIAHDFNNVLTLITGFAQLALAELPPAHAARSNTEQVLQAAGRAMALTRQLLSFSRRQVPAEGSIDLNTAIARSVAARQPGMVLALSAEPAPVYARQRQVEEMLRELSLNVRHGFPARTVEVRTELIQVDEDFCPPSGDIQPGPYTVLSVGDFGTAFDGDVAAVCELFGARSAREPYASVMLAGESAALGLATTHATIAQCGGFIVAGSRPQSFRTSEVQAITRFHVFLPSALSPAGATHERTSGPAGETILLVENEPLVRELSRDMLERQGYRVILASDAKDAEQIGCSGGSLDLLITDAVMPGITGSELARRLRSAHPGLKVLFISGYADDLAEDEETGLESAAFLQKPFSVDSLGRKIRQILKHA